MEALDTALNQHGAQHYHTYRFKDVTQVPLEGCPGRLLLTGHHEDEARLERLERDHQVSRSFAFWSPDDNTPPFPSTAIRELLPVNDPNHYNHPEDFAVIANTMSKTADGVLGLLDDELRTGHTVLVCCATGVSRSVTLVLLYSIMRDARRGTCHDTLEEYVWALKGLRSCVAPDLCFLELLDAYLARQRTAAPLPFAIWTPPEGAQALAFHAPRPLTPTVSFSDSQTNSQ